MTSRFAFCIQWVNHRDRATPARLMRMGCMSKIPTSSPTRRLGWLALAVPLATASCAGLDRVDQGSLQPQTVSGPCQVKKFFLVNYTAVPTEMTVSNAGQACGISLINPALQFFNTAALVTANPAHGQATSGLVLGGTQAVASYTPQPGFTGTDSFTVTLEPRDRAIKVNVTVQPG